ncbi:MAG: hypothetical protein H6Q73_3181 [Firmicutes bacterium]|nr:hypothetical protein [Bacillota bacterium]
MADKADSAHVVINEIYGIASELLILPDKAAQECGKQLRKLLEQLEREITQK